EAERRRDAPIPCLEKIERQQPAGLERAGDAEEERLPLGSHEMTLRSPASPVHPDEVAEVVLERVLGGGHEPGVRGLTLESPQLSAHLVTVLCRQAVEVRLERAGQRQDRGGLVLLELEAHAKPV